MVLIGALMLAPPATASYQRCGNVAITPNSGDLWAKVKVSGVSCAYARRFLRRTSLPAGWRERVVRRSDPAVCGGPRVKFYKGARVILASRSAC